MTRSAWGARARERKRWCSWTCSSTTAADDGCTRRTTPSSELGARKTRRRERCGALLSVTLRGAPPRREERERKRETRRTDRPTDRSMLAWVADLFCSLLCILQRGRGQDEVIISSFSVPSFGFQGSQARGRVPGAPRCCFEGENHPWLRDGDTAVRFRAFCILVGEL